VTANTEVWRWLREVADVLNPWHHQIAAWRPTGRGTAIVAKSVATVSGIDQGSGADQREGLARTVPRLARAAAASAVRARVASFTYEHGLTTKRLPRAQR
jgi:hypothetical protein